MESISLKSQTPLFLACQILGVLPCDRKFQSSRFGAFYSVAVNVLVCGWVSYRKLSHGFWDSGRANGNFIVELMVVIRELTDILIIGTHACSLLFRKKTLEKVVTGIKFLELSKNSDGIPRKFFYVIFILCNAIVLSTATRLCPPLYFHSQSNQVEMELPYLISFFAASSFAAPLDYLRNQLDHMTESLQPNEKTLSLQLDLALFILDLSRSLNKFYSMQIFLLCCRVLINFILSGYFIIDSFRTNSLFTPSEVIWINYLVSVALVVSFAGDLSVLIRICSSCTNFQNAQLFTSHYSFKK